MAGFGDALLGIATGAANVINKDAEKDREFMRKQKVKIADSRLIRQEKEYDKRKAQYDMVQKYGTDEKGQYMHAYGIFKDHTQAVRATKAGIFSDVLKTIKDPGTFTPYDIGLVTDEEVRSRYGDNSVTGKILGAFGNTKARRSDVRLGQQNGRTQEMDALSLRADEALGLGKFTPVAEDENGIDVGNGYTQRKIVDENGEEITVTTIQHDTPEIDTADMQAFFKEPNIVKHERDGDQLITTVTDANNNLVSTKATAISNYRTFTRPEVDLERGIATWSETLSDGTVETFSGPIQDLPEEASKGFTVSNATYNSEAGGYTVLERDEDTKEMRTTFLEVEGVPEGQDQSKVKWISFNATDPKTGETTQKHVAAELVGKGTDREIKVIDAIQVTTSTTTAMSPQPAAADSRNRALSIIEQMAVGGGDAGAALSGFSSEQKIALATQVADEALKLSAETRYKGMNYSEIERQATIRIVKAEALRQKLRAGKQE
jgi:hypothetical protein